MSSSATGGQLATGRSGDPGNGGTGPSGQGSTPRASREGSRVPSGDPSGDPPGQDQGTPKDPPGSSSPTSPADPQPELLALTILHAAVIQADRRTGRETTVAHVEASLEAHAELDRACEAFRAAHYPRAGKVFASYGEVFVVSPAGRKMTRVYPE